MTGYLGERVDWHLGFAAAGVGMVLGLVQYVLGGRHLGQAGLVPKGAPKEAGRRGGMGWLAGVCGLAALLGGLHLVGWVDLRTAQGWLTAAGIVILGSALAYFGAMLGSARLSSEERKRLAAIALLFVFSAVFWSGFEQAGSSLNLFADRLTDRLVLGWEVPASFFQSVNALLIIALAPAFAWLWIFLNKRRREPSSPAKFAFGLFFMGLGFVVMALAALLAAKGEKVSPMWLVVTYLLHTFGELSLSPVGLSTVTKLAPERMVGQMMGVWFMSISLGNLAAGQVAGLFGKLPLPQLFGAVAAVGALAALLLGLLVRPMRALAGPVR